MYADMGESFEAAGRGAFFEIGFQGVGIYVVRDE